MKKVLILALAAAAAVATCFLVADKHCENEVRTNPGKKTNRDRHLTKVFSNAQARQTE